jgi:hypothetical protein
MVTLPVIKVETPLQPARKVPVAAEEPLEPVLAPVTEPVEVVPVEPVPEPVAVELVEFELPELAVLTWVDVGHPASSVESNDRKSTRRIRTSRADLCSSWQLKTR